MDENNEPKMHNFSYIDGKKIYYFAVVTLVMGFMKMALNLH